VPEIPSMQIIIVYAELQVNTQSDEWTSTRRCITTLSPSEDSVDAIHCRLTSTPRPCFPERPPTSYAVPLALRGWVEQAASRRRRVNKAEPPSREPAPTVTSVTPRLRTLLNSGGPFSPPISIQFTYVPMTCSHVGCGNPRPSLSRYVRNFVCIIPT
jgi:hypothetical protein